ncbi:hypothetical protein PIB30_011299 [Stylosanthes scabra]|uniref:3-hydroxyisobutyryl-CoA hydrolase n=1 Tax=Stylosanthes scabra TaxID=79078 RepID=A0ABU6V7D3_9FABA|nr:hypothetical protein [Stylosanthes scabra]
MSYGYLHKGNGRAFCAGGDVSALVHDVKGGGDELRMAVYLPNAVFRQFGLAQAISSPFHPQGAQPLDVKASSTEELLNFQKDNAVRKSKFHLFSAGTCMLTISLLLPGGSPTILPSKFHLSHVSKG